MPHTTAQQPTPASPPVARREPTTTTLHGVALRDDYGWLRRKDSPEVTAYLEAENAWTAAATAPTEALQRKLYDEMLSHIKETDESVPYRMGDWFYSTRTVEGKQYPIHCRRQASDLDPNSPLDRTQPEQVILDVNQLAQGKSFMAVGALSVSPDGNLLAYTTDPTGFRQYTLHIRDLRTMVDLPDAAERVGSLAWAADSRTIFYSTEDEVTKRHDRIFRHTLGALAPDDVLALHEEDERFNIGIGRTRDGQFLMIEAGSHTTNEFRFLSTSDPTGDFRLIAPRMDDREYYPSHRDGIFFIRTNDVGKNFRVVIAPVVSPGREQWAELIPLNVEHPLEDLDMFRTFAVATRLKMGLPTLEVLRFKRDVAPENAASIAFEPPVEIAFPEPAYSASSHVNRVFDADTWHYAYQSLVSPPSVYAYNISRAEFDVPIGQSKLLKQQEVPGGFNSALYASERIWIDAPSGDATGAHVERAPATDITDSVRVPISIVYRRDRFRRDGVNPLYVYGYGAYGYPLPLGFSPSRLSLLDRGVVMAYAHVRGGGELGDAWHDAGKMAAKRNTFTDFIAATEALTKSKYGDPKRVAIEGGSAGGLLMGAVVNLAAQSGKPALFRVVLSHVPFVDIMNTMLDASLPLTVAEYEEWGNPNEPSAFRKMLSYSPYDNLEVLAGKPLPAILVKTSLNDSQVMYWEPAKYVAKLRTIKTDATPLLLHTNMDAGHGGASGRYDYLKEIAFDYAFLLRELDVEKA